MPVGHFPPSSKALYWRHGIIINLITMDEQTSNQSQTPQAKPEQKTLMGILAYLGILVVIPFLMAKDDPFVKFHIKQGLVLVVIELVVWVLGTSMWQLWMILNLVNLATLVLAIVGIVNVIQGKQKELPLVGSFSKYFTF